jgi:alcohol dehydrogenase class IV
VSPGSARQSPGCEFPACANFGLRAADYDAVAARALTASSTQGNPVVLTAAELRAILAEAA